MGRKARFLDTGWQDSEGFYAKALVTSRGHSQHCKEMKGIGPSLQFLSDWVIQHRGNTAQKESGSNPIIIAFSSICSKQMRTSVANEEQLQMKWRNWKWQQTVYDSVPELILEIHLVWTRIDKRWSGVQKFQNNRYFFILDPIPLLRVSCQLLFSYYIHRHPKILQTYSW